MAENVAVNVCKRLAHCTSTSLPSKSLSRRGLAVTGPIGLSGNDWALRYRSSRRQGCRLLLRKRHARGRESGSAKSGEYCALGCHNDQSGHQAGSVTDTLAVRRPQTSHSNPSLASRPRIEYSNRRLVGWTRLRGKMREIGRAHV